MTGRARTVDLAARRHVHVVAVGGYAMSAIARYLTELGHEVTGCDVNDSVLLTQLAAEGIAVHVGHDEAHLPDPCDFLSVATAVRRDTPEIVAAAFRGIPVLGRGETMRLIAATKPNVAVVSGTHGKTSTTAMVTHVLERLGTHPSFFVGGVLRELATNARHDPAGTWLVVEGDESDHSFLDFDRTAALVTNIEPDHLDRWGDEFSNLVDGFARFVDGATGPVVLCADDARTAALASNRPRASTYGFAATADARGADYRSTRDGCALTVELGGTRLELELRLRGRDMAQNAIGALALVHELGHDVHRAGEALATFAGVSRRFEFRGSYNGADCYDDYAHTATEVRTTLARAREGGWKRIVAVFQPHRYTRIGRHWPEFATAFDDADVVVVTGLDPAFEDPIPGVSGELVARAVREHRPEVELYYLPDWQQLADLPWRIGQAGDCIVTLGCGTITGAHREWAATGTRRP
jgi:UDP-N-acetylmuramate--alanine ligase